MELSPLSEAELQQLVRRAQEGDTEAFGKIYDHFFTAVYRYAAFRLPKEIAEDTTADIFVKAWEKLHTYKIQKNVPFGAWIFRIARYTVIDTYRTQRGFEEVSETLPDTDNFNRAETRLERKETLLVVRHALEQLPRRYRDVLLLTYVSELPYSEVARVLRMTEGGVRILKMRALRKLEALLPPETRFEP
jgi:RNA polymerase sigma-70 factor (ECF subfamily)